MSLQRAINYFERLVERVVSRLDYHGRYAARVIGQANDGSLELVPDDARVPPEAGASMRTGLPGVTIKVPQGTRVQLAYENGDPRKPVVADWESGPASEMTITVTGPFRISAAGQPAIEHVLTTEAAANILAQVLNVLGLAITALGGSPLTGLTLGPLLSTPLVNTSIGLGLTVAKSAHLDPAITSAIRAGFESVPIKSDPGEGIPQSAPGIGCSGFLGG
jgi:hypothetical protein